MMRLFLCEAKWKKRSIVDLCEHLAIRRFVQKELIRTILIVFSIPLCVGGCCFVKAE